MNVNYGRVILFVLFCSVVLAGYAHATDYPPGQWVHIIEDQEFINTIDLRGSENDNTLIINCTVHDVYGNGIFLRNIHNVYIKNCTIYNVSNNGIHLSSRGSTSDVTIDTCDIYEYGKNGIIAGQDFDLGVDHENLKIINCTIHDGGTNLKYDHGIYVQSQDSVIENNEIYNSNAGHGISIRSSGTIRNNIIWDSYKCSIRYFSDHMRGKSNVLIIENNMCYENAPPAGDSCISIYRSEDSFGVENFIIGFNTAVVLGNKDIPGINIRSGLDDRYVKVFGNLVVSLCSDPAFITGPIDYTSRNYTDTSLNGFVNTKKNPYDFHLKANHPAREYATGEDSYPSTDIDGEERPSQYNELNAGADQFYKGSKRNKGE